MLGPSTESAILTRSDQGAIPPASRLESTALHLEAKGDLRTLICFVESWSEHAQPTLPARLAQARALVSLGLMDRAWARLKDLVEAREGGVETALVAARMFLERGWLKQARHTVQTAMADHPDEQRLQALWDQVIDPPPAPDPAAGEAEDASVEVLLALANHHMATGTFVKARGLLERLKRAAPQHPRVSDLLWALDGDFRIQGSLATLAATHGPDLAALADLADDADRTAEADRRPGVVERELGEGGSASSFPVLFRHLEAHTEQYQGHEEPEVTQLSSMAAIEEMRRAAIERTESGSDDTQILRVIHKNAPSEPAPEPGTETSTFDLSAARRELNMRADPPGDFADAPEAEDDDLIIITRREQEDDESPAPTSGNKGLDLVAEAEPAPKTRLKMADEDAAWVRPAPGVERARPSPEPGFPPGDPAPDRSPATPAAPSPPPTSTSAWPWGLAAVGGMMILLGGLLALVVVLHFLSTMLL